jgi:hypothetical protein
MNTVPLQFLESIAKKEQVIQYRRICEKEEDVSVTGNSYAADAGISTETDDDLGTSSVAVPTSLQLQQSVDFIPSPHCHPTNINGTSTVSLTAEGRKYVEFLQNLRLPPQLEGYLHSGNTSDRGAKQLGRRQHGLYTQKETSLTKAVKVSFSAQFEAFELNRNMIAIEVTYLHC